MATKDYSLIKGKGTGSVGGLADVGAIIEGLIELQRGGDSVTTAAPGKTLGGTPPSSTGRKISAVGQDQYVPPALRKGVTPGTGAAPIKPSPSGRATTGIGAAGAGAGGGGMFASGMAKAGGTGGGVTPSVSYGTGGGFNAPQAAQTTQAPSTASPSGGDGGGNWASKVGDYGALLGGATGGIGTVVGLVVDAIWGDDESKADRAARHLMEQQFEMRQNFNKAYTDVFLPLEMATKVHAYQQIGKKSENYEYAANALKGYIEGSAGVWGGEGSWNNVFDSLDLSATDRPDEGGGVEGYLERVEYEFERGTPNAGITAMVNWALIEMGMPKGIALGVANELMKWGNALMKGLQ